MRMCYRLPAALVVCVFVVVMDVGAHSPRLSDDEDTEKRGDNQRQFIGKREDQLSQNGQNLWSSHHVEHTGNADVDRLAPLDVQHQAIAGDLLESLISGASSKRGHSWSYMKRMPQFIGKRGGKMRFIGKRDEFAQTYPLEGYESHDMRLRRQLQNHLRRELDQGVQILQEKRQGNSRKFIGKRKSLFIG